MYANMYANLSLRQAMDFLKPTTLVAIIADCTEEDGISDPKGRAIITAAMEVLDANMGLDEARPMIEAEGVDFSAIYQHCWKGGLS